MRDTIDMAREAGFTVDPSRDGPDDVCGVGANLEFFEALVRADERKRFYGQDKPAECAEGCPPNQICEYCQVVAPVKAMILAEREACAKVCDEVHAEYDGEEVSASWIASAIRARGETK
jgi:hypothetical protein